MDSIFQKILAVLLTLGLFGGGPAPALMPAAPPVTAETPGEKVIHYQLDSDFLTLDPGVATAVNDLTGTKQIFEGLVRLTEKGLAPGMAERWEVLDGGKKYVFHLRNGVRWSNGDPVTAYDFAFAWTRVLDPKFYAEYSYQLYCVRGAEAFNNVDPKDAVRYEAAKKALGIKAVDSRTLEVTLEVPTPYFLQLTAFPTLLPVPQITVAQHSDWVDRPLTLVTNGPFKLLEWTPRRRAVFVKNPNYWNASAVKVDKLVFDMIGEPATALQLFETGKLDVMGAPPPTEAPRLEKEGKLRYASIVSTYFYTMNTTVKPFNDPRVRQALALALDTNALRTVVPWAQPAHALVPFGIPDAAPGSDFRAVGGDLFHQEIPEAKRLLAEAGYPGGAGFPEFDLYYNTNSTHESVAKLVVGQWKQNLGISVKPVSMEWKVLLNHRMKGDFTLSRSGWYGDYLDAITFLELTRTGGINNDARYSNPEYDALIRETWLISDQEERQTVMHKAESLLIRDMPIIPLYHYRELYLQSPKVTGVFHDPFQTVDFTFAAINN